MPFLAPLGLALTALSVPLVAMYFLKLRRKRVRVPSTLLWQAFVKSERLASPFERFRRNLLLLLQLLLLLLLALATARPFLETEAALVRSVVLVIDTSASMGADDVSPDRLGAAVREAERAVDGLGPGDEAMLVVAGARTEVVVPFTRDRAAVSAALDGLRASDAEGSLREGLHLALSMARSRPGVEVAVFSDGGTETLTDVPAGDTTIRYVAVGRSDANAAIVAVDLRRSPVSELDRELFVTVQDFGRDAVEGTVEVYLKGELVGLRTEVLAPDVPTSMVFSLPGTSQGELRVQLHSDADHLAADDEAWLVVSPLSHRRILLVGGDGLTARALAADPRVSLTRVAAGAVTAADLDAADAVLFADGAVPPGLEGRPYAVLGPLSGGPVTFGESVRAPGVVGWTRTHPVLRYVEWGDVRIGKAMTVANPGSLAPIVDGDAGPLVLAGEISGARVLQLAFDPLDTDLLLRVAWPVTLLNTVGWLTEGAGSDTTARAIVTGSPYVRRLPEGTDPATVKVTAPDGAPADVQIADGVLRVRDTTRAGVYMITAPGLSTSFAANLLSAKESDIAPRSTLALDAGAVGTSVAGLGGRRELWRPLALAAIALMLLEWLAYHRRRAA